MDSHPVTVARFVTNAALVLVLAAMVPSVLLGVGPRPIVWTWAIFAVALGGSAAQAAAAIVWRRGVEASGDELVRRSDAASYVFGYWVVMAAFLTLLAAVWTGRMSAEAAFYWLATPLAVSPAAWMLVAFLRGRAG